MKSIEERIEELQCVGSLKISPSPLSHILPVLHTCLLSNLCITACCHSAA